MTVVTSAAYVALHRDVTSILEAGQGRARRAMERERVRTYWLAGQVLHRYLPADGDRPLNAHLLQRLSEDLELSRSLLYEMLHFFRAFPLERDLDRLLADLSWTHCRALLAIPDDEARQRYARQVQQQGLSVRQLNEQIRAQAQDEAPAPEVALAVEEVRRGSPLQPKRGLLHTYRLVPPVEALGRGISPLVDVGFSIHLPTVDIGATLIGDIDPTSRYTSQRDGSSYRLQRLDDPRARHYTYIGVINSVVDGDTVWAYVDCGYGVWVRQKLRLRGIDTPEMRSAAGQRSCDFVAHQLSQVDFVALTTTRPDKYDRYLTDIFYLPGETDPETVLRQGTFLNRQLLNEGLAQRMTD